MEFWESEKIVRVQVYLKVGIPSFTKRGASPSLVNVPTYLLGTLGVWSTMAKPGTPPHASWRNQLRRPTVL